VLSIVLGVFLLVTAGLKIHGLYTDPYSQESVLLTPRLLVAVIEVEILLGLWLLSGLAMRAAWLAALAFFAAGAAANVYLAVEGQRSCGCFGAVAVHPWWTVALDVVIVLFLVTVRPASTPALPDSGWLASVATSALGAAAILTVICGVFFLLFDNPTAALAWLRGEAVTVEPYVTDVGEGVAGEWRTFTIRVRNHGNRTVRIFGGTTSCACIATKDLPVDIPPYESRSIRVEMGFRGLPGRFVHDFVLLTDSPGQFTVRARYAGRVGQAPLP